MDWYYQEDGVQVGPLTDDEFDTRVKVGRVAPETMVWNETMRGWQPFGSLQAAACAGSCQIPGNTSYSGYLLQPVFAPISTDGHDPVSEFLGMRVL